MGTINDALPNYQFAGIQSALDIVQPPSWPWMQLLKLKWVK